MYNTKYQPIYKNKNIFANEDELSETDKDIIIDALYREDLMNILGVENFNEEDVNKIISDLHSKVSIHPDLTLLMKQAANSFMSEDNEFGLIILFSFDYLDITHSCLCEFLETGIISQEKINTLKNALSSLC